MNNGAEPEVNSVAVIGMACRFPGADDPGAFWRNLVGGVESITRGPDSGTYIRAVGKVPGTEFFDADFFRIPPVEATAMDPQTRVLLELSATALEDAGYLGERKYVVGVFAGSGENTYYKEHVAPDDEFCENLGELRLALANEKDFLAPRIAFKLGLAGPSVSVQASCATGLTAVTLACQAITAGDCDLAIAGGVSLLLPETDGYQYTKGGINSVDGRCRAFDQLASGPIPASGAGAVVLKRDALARADGDHRYAVVRGWAINSDGGSRAGFTVPNVAGQEAVIRRAMQRAGIRPRDVSYIEAHGTGTPLGDPVEIEALSRVFSSDDRGPGACAIGSVKTNIGHTDAAAGIAGLIKAVLAVRTGTIPATLHFTEPNPAIDFVGTPFAVNVTARPWPENEAGRIAGVSSFGLGGTNAHVVVAEAFEPELGATRRLRHLLVLSARDDESLGRAKVRLADWFDDTADRSERYLADAAYTTAVARTPYAARWAGAFGTAEEAVTALREPHSPAARSTRLSLAVRGRPDDLVALAQQEVAAEPLARTALDEYAEALGLAAADDVFRQLPAHAAATVAVLVCLRALHLAGVRLARVDAPAWAAPAVHWMLAERPLDELPAVVETCPTDTAEQLQVPAPDSLVIGPDYHLAGAVAHAWARGAAVNWTQYYGAEPRRRVPLPTYPFARQRYWLEKKPRRTYTPEVADTPDSRSSKTVADIVEAAWRGVFGLETVDRHADFFELGGDSLTSVEIGARLNEELGLSLPLDLSFEAPTIAAMIEFIESFENTTRQE
ncbi:phosphopantetheine-binding protein (plasmid) [Streptomyces sp. NBC_01216]|uniref:beta-ketoacyl synthase N-terminal-like domain-containing protein n=1 Tax=Streptomyces sp. NBC_01216 TaxID=2903778 RepID=UPI002E0D257B|nr:phosphopantetheine-binding protein [Streptomyces sp. NBC_01216]